MLCLGLSLLHSSQTLLQEKQENSEESALNALNSMHRLQHLTYVRQRQGSAMIHHALHVQYSIDGAQQLPDNMQH